MQLLSHELTQMGMNEKKISWPLGERQKTRVGAASSRDTSRQGWRSYNKPYRVFIIRVNSCLFVGK